jgi:hypothetical protein
MSMEWEYTVKVFSTDDLKKEGVVVDPQRNIVYACKPDGGCAVQDVNLEQMERFTMTLNGMGKDGWELVQLVFRSSGIVSFWKRCLEEGVGTA